MSISRLAEGLEHLDIDELDLGGVTAGLRDLRRLKGFVADTEHALARRANALAAAGSGAPADELLSQNGHISRREATRTARRAETLGSLPSVSAQLSNGRIGTEHADALAATADRMTDEARETLLSMDSDLAQAAASTSPPRFRRLLERLRDQIDADSGLERNERQRRAVTLAKGINHDTGMYWIRAEYDPESGARLFRAIDAETSALAARHDNTDAPKDRLAAEALVELATSATRVRRPGRVELLAVVDIATIITGVHADTTAELSNGTPIPVDTIRRLACDAHIIPVVLNGEGVALDVGRSRRLATNDQRRALRAMYRSCGVGECDVPFDQCEVHHLDEWQAQHGNTNLDRLIPCCKRHHHLLHEGRWQLELDPHTRELTVTLPDGTLHQRSRPHSATAPTVPTAA